MAQIHELNTLGRDPASTDVLAIDNGSATRKIMYSAFKGAVIAGVSADLLSLSAAVDLRAKSSAIAAEDGEDGIASKDYAVGDCFMWENELYAATAAIYIGDPFQVGTNCAKTTVIDQINLLKSAIAALGN